MLELFRFPYKSGCVEDYVSKRSLENRYFSLCEKNITVKEMAESARCNDPYAKKVFADVGKDIIEIMTPIMNKYDFSCLLIGGQIAKAADLMMPAMHAAMKGNHQNYDLFAAGEITQAALLGAVLSVK